MFNRISSTRPCESLEHVVDTHLTKSKAALFSGLCHEPLPLRLPISSGCVTKRVTVAQGGKQRSERSPAEATLKSNTICELLGIEIQGLEVT